MFDKSQFSHPKSSSSNNSTSDCVTTYVHILHTHSSTNMPITRVAESQNASVVPSKSPHINSVMNSLERDSLVSSSTLITEVVESSPTPILSTTVAEPPPPIGNKHFMVT